MTLVERLAYFLADRLLRFLDFNHEQDQEDAQ